MIDPVTESSEATRLAWKAVRLGSDDPVALCMGAYVLAFIAHEFDDAMAFVDRGLAINPNSALAWNLGAWIRIFRGEGELVCDYAARAMRLSPLDPSLYAVIGDVAYAHFLAGDYDMASLSAVKSLRDNPDHLLTLCVSAASNALTGRLAPARKSIARVCERNSDLRISNIEDLAPFRRAEDMARFVEGLRAAGLPE
jgi:tetratricopeptide (TPR) repeat protein